MVTVCLAAFSNPAGGDSHTDYSESPLPPAQKAQTRVKTFNPFCNVDQVELSIHCHINAVKSLISVPALVPKDLGEASTHNVQSACLCGIMTKMLY